jgi:hypothetical protein
MATSDGPLCDNIAGQAILNQIALNVSNTAPQGKLNG